MFPKTLLTRIEGAVETRNRIVHRGELPESDEDAALVLVAANDLLYRLDWFSGHDWALDYVSREVADAYGSSE